MRAEKITQRYRHLRILIERGKSDAALWGTKKQCQVMQGIKETSALDYPVYERTYQKELAKRISNMSDEQKQVARDIEYPKPPVPIDYEKESLTQLTRIADALEAMQTTLRESLTLKEGAIIDEVVKEISELPIPKSIEQT